MTTKAKSNVNKTGYADIDRILLKSHDLLQQSAQLQKDIKVALQKEGGTPSSSRRKKEYGTELIKSHWMINNNIE